MPATKNPAKPINPAPRPVNALDQLLQFRLADWMLAFFENSSRIAPQTPPRFPTKNEFDNHFKDLFPGADYTTALLVIQNIADKYKIPNIGQNIILLRQVFAELIQNDLTQLEITNETAVPIIEKIKEGDNQLPKSGLATLEEIDSVIDKIRQEKSLETLPPVAELPEKLTITPLAASQPASDTQPLPASPQPIQAPLPADKTKITLPSNAPVVSKESSSASKESQNSTTQHLEDTVSLAHTELKDSIKNLVLTPAVSTAIFPRQTDAPTQSVIAQKIADTVSSSIVYSTHTQDYQELSPVIASEIYEAAASEPLTASRAPKLLKSEDFLTEVDAVSETSFPSVSQANVASQILLISTLTDPKQSPTPQREIVENAVATGLKLSPKTNTADNKAVVTTAISTVFLPTIASKILTSTQKDFDKNIPLSPDRLLTNLTYAQDESFQTLLKNLDEKLSDKTVLTAAAPRFIADTVTQNILSPINVYAQGQKNTQPELQKEAENHVLASLMDNPKRQKQSYEEFLVESLHPSRERNLELSRSVRELKDQNSRTLGQEILLQNYSDELTLYQTVPAFNSPPRRSIWRSSGFSRQYFSHSASGQAVTRSANFVPKASFFKFTQKFSAGRAKGTLKAFAKKGAAKVAAKVGVSAAIGAASGGTSLLVQAGLYLANKFKKKIAYALAFAAYLSYLLFLWLLAQATAFVIGALVGAGIGFALGGPIGALAGGFLGGVASAWLYNHFPPYAAFVDNIILNLPKLWGVITAPVSWVGAAFGAVSATASFIGSAASSAWGVFTGGISSVGSLLSSGGGAGGGIIATLASPGVAIPTAAVGGVATFSILSYNIMASALFTNPSLPEQIVLPGDATEGETANAYIQIQKLVTAPSKSLGPAKTINLENSDLPQTITYTVNITANSQPVYDIVCTDTISHRLKSGTTRTLPTPTVNCPTSLTPNQTSQVSYSINLPSDPDFHDSSINNRFSINFKSFDPEITPIPNPTGGFSNSVSAGVNDSSTVFIGTPASECPSGWPTSGSGRVTQGPTTTSSHSGSEAVDIATFYQDNLVSTFNGIIYAKYSDPDAFHPIGGRTGNSLVIQGTCNGAQFLVIYGHMDAFAPNTDEGQPVTKGQLVGYEGFTGYVLPPGIGGTHIHYEFRNLLMEPPYIPLDVRYCETNCATVP